MTDQEIDPFIKRIVTVKPGDVVIFRYNGPQPLATIKAGLEAKMGSIPFIVIGPEFDLTVLKPAIDSDTDGVGFA